MNVYKLIDKQLSYTLKFSIYFMALLFLNEKVISHNNTTITLTKLSD